MTVAINQKIVEQRVIAGGKGKDGPEVQAGAIQKMDERLERPDCLMGTTYRFKPATSEHAMYLTINDVILNEGTEHESRRPYEVFINSKCMEHFQWVIALTRVMSAVFRKGGDIAFLVEELRSVYDPKGGYFKKGGVFMPSIVAEIGSVLEKHLVSLGLMEKEALSDHARAFIAKMVGPEGSEPTPQGKQCTKCRQFSVTNSGGCETCLECGNSACM